MGDPLSRVEEKEAFEDHQQQHDGEPAFEPGQRVRLTEEHLMHILTLGSEGVVKAVSGRFVEVLLDSALARCEFEVRCWQRCPPQAG